MLYFAGLDSRAADSQWHSRRTAACAAHGARVFAWAGHPAFADPLLQADPLWRKKQCSKAFTLLTNKIPGLMCWGARGFKEDLIRFLTREFVECYRDDGVFREKMLGYVFVKSRCTKIDSVDPRITRGLLRARLGIAEEAYKKRNPSKVNWPLIESLASANKSCPEFSLWRLRVRQLVLESCYVSEEKLAALVAATLPLSPNLFRFEVACRIGMSNYQMAVKAGVLEKILPSRPAPQSLADFLAVIDEVEASGEGVPYTSARNVAHEIFMEHQDRLVESIVERKDLTTLLIKIFSSRFPSPSLASPVIQKWFASHPSDPVLLYLCRSYNFSWLPKPPKEDSHEIATRFRNSKDPDDLHIPTELSEEQEPDENPELATVFGDLASLALESRKSNRRTSKAFS